MQNMQTNIGSGWLQYRLHFELCIPVMWLWFPQFIMEHME